MIFSYKKKRACRHHDDAYANVASYYDFLLQRIVRRVRQEVLDICHDYNESRILDICCGTGEQLALLSKAGISSFGIDRSQAMLREAKKKDTCVVHGDAVAMPFIDMSFSLATVSFALHEMPYACAERIVIEALRVAETLLIVDYCMAERNISLPFVWACHAVERIVGGEHYNNYRYFMQQGAVEGLVSHLGLTTLSRQLLYGGAIVIQLVSR